MEDLALRSPEPRGHDERREEHGCRAAAGALVGSLWRGFFEGLKGSLYVKEPHNTLMGAFQQLEGFLEGDVRTLCVKFNPSSRVVEGRA